MHPCNRSLGCVCVRAVLYASDRQELSVSLTTHSHNTGLRQPPQQLRHKTPTNISQTLPADNSLQQSTQTQRLEATGILPP